MQDFKAKMQKIRFLLGAPDAFLDTSGGAYSTPLTPLAGAEGVNPLPKNTHLPRLFGPRFHSAPETSGSAPLLENS